MSRCWCPLKLKKLTEIVGSTTLQDEEFLNKGNFANLDKIYKIIATKDTKWNFSAKDVGSHFHPLESMGQ